MTPDPLQRLRDQVRGEDPASAALALQELLGADEADSYEELGAIIGDTEHSPDVRHRAVLHLARMAPERAPDMLVDRSADPDELVRIGVALALGRTGDESALPALRDMVASGPPEVADRARFAMTLIVHRLGLVEDVPPAPSAGKPLPVEAARRPISVRRANMEEGELCLGELRRAGIGVDLAASPLFVWQEEGGGGFIVFNAAVVEVEDLLDQLLSRPSLPVVLARRSEATGRCIASSILLCTPRPRGAAADLSLCSLSGAPQAAGELVRSSGAETATFWLRSGEQSFGAPLAVEGIVRRHSAEITSLRGGGVLRAQPAVPWARRTDDASPGTGP